MLYRASLCTTLMLLALLATHTWFGPDIWYHLTWAREILRQATVRPTLPTLVSGQNVTNPYWLYQLALGALFDAGGVTLVSLVFAAAWVVIGLIWMRLTRAAGAWPALGFVALVQLRLEYRPETWSFLFLAVMLWTLSEPRGRWRVWLMLFTEAVWVNVHGYFILGPAVVGAAWLARRDRRHGWMFAGVLASTLLNPGGFRAFESVVAMSRVLGALGGVIEELTPTWRYAWWYWPMPVFWIYVAGVVAAIFARGGRAPWAKLLALAGVALGLRSIRFIPAMLLLTAPLIGATWPRPPRWTDGVALIAALVAGVVVVSGQFHRWTGSGTRFGFGLEWAEYPIGVTDFLRARGFTGRVFNEPNDGGYFEYHLPGVTVASDSSYVDVNAVRDYFAAAYDPVAFARGDQTWHFDAAVIAITNEAMVQSLLHAPVWAPVYADSHRIVFMKNATAIRLSEAPHRHGGDWRRYGYAEAAAAWVRLAEREGDARLRARLREEF